MDSSKPKPPWQNKTAASMGVRSGHPPDTSFPELWEVNSPEDGGCDMAWRVEGKTGLLERRKQFFHLKP